MTVGDWRDEGEASSASNGAARVRRIQGVIEIAMSDLEREEDVGTAELAVHLLRTQMNRVIRLEGLASYAAFVGNALDLLAEHKRTLSETMALEMRKRAH